ncbi:MAG: S8 family serine peptidase [Gammaproteobacteria bacterium]
MNAITLLLWLLLLYPSGPASASGSTEENTAIDDHRASKMILVTFTDRSINRVAADAAGSRYRQRGYSRGSTWSARIAEQIAETYRLTQINAWPISELGVYCVVYEVGADASIETVLEALQRDSRIDLAQPMHLFHTLAAHYSDPYFPLQNNLEMLQIEAAHRKATGQGITVAVIDTGVDVEHPDLKGQVAEHRDLTGADGKSFSDDLHGTAVAGAIGALADNGRGIVGIAPDAELSVFKACWPAKPGALQAACNSLTLALALNHAITLKPHILNLSLSGPPDPLLRQLLERAMASGIIVVAAAAEVAEKNGGFPASMPGVIAVYAPAQITVNSMSRNLLTAPGEAILTTFPHDTYNFISGSSIAAAQLSGVAALLLEVRPESSSADILAVLNSSAASVHMSGGRTVAMINAEAAITRLLGIRLAVHEKKISRLNLNAPLGN